MRKRFLNLQEAVSYMGVSEDIIRELRDKNLIKAYMIKNRFYLYDIDSIDEFVLSRDILKV